MRNPVIVAHKRIIRRQWIEAVATQAAGYAAAVIAIASVYATGAYALNASLDGSRRTRPPVVAMGLLLSLAGAGGAKAISAEADSDWAYYRSLRDETALIVANAARLEAENNWAVTAMGAAVVSGVAGAAISSAVADKLPPARDVAGEIAAADGHSCLVAKTRSGKTTLMIEGIHRDLAQGRQVILIDGKGDRRLQQLQGVTYIQVNRAERVPKLIATMDSVLRTLASRQDGTAGAEIALWIDEHNLVRTAAAQYAKLAKREKDTEGAEVEDDYLMGVERVLLQGASAGIYARLSSHTSRVADLGLNTGVLDSVSFIALGRQGRNESLEDLLLYQVKGKAKKQLEAQLEQLTAQAHVLGETPLILTMMHPRGFCLPTAPAVEPQPVSVATAQPQQANAQDIRQQLEGVLQRSPADLPPDGLPMKRPESKLNRLLDYIRRNGPVKRRKLLQNWAGNCGVNALTLDAMLETLTTTQTVVVSSQGYEIAPDYT